MMRKQPRFAAALAACALSAALLAGCGNGSSSSMASSASPSPAASSSATGESSAASNAVSGTAESTAAAAAYKPEDLKAALDSTVSYEVDTAGGSLHTAKAAATLVSFLSGIGKDAPTLAQDAGSWKSSLAEKEAGVLPMNWPQVYKVACDIVADPAAQADMLADAGVETDFTKMDLSNVSAHLDTLNGVLSKT